MTTSAKLNIEHFSVNVTVEGFFDDSYDYNVDSGVWNNEDGSETEMTAEELAMEVNRFERHIVEALHEELECSDE